MACGATLKDQFIEREARKAELTTLLATAEEPPTLLHPNMATYYREQVTHLHTALREETEEKRLEAGEVLRSLVQRIVLTPENGELKIELIGDLARILTIAVKGGAPSQTQKSRPSRAAVLSNLASQVEMIAGAGFDLNLRRVVSGGPRAVASHCGLFRTTA